MIELRHFRACQSSMSEENLVFLFSSIDDIETMRWVSYFSVVFNKIYIDKEMSDKTV